MDHVDADHSSQTGVSVSSRPATLLPVVVHARVPGRVRLRDTRLYRNQTLSESLTAHLENHDSIRDISTNPVTGTILIRYAPARPLDEIVALVRVHLDSHPQPQAPTGRHPAVIDLAAARAVRRRTAIPAAVAIRPNAIAKIFQKSPVPQSRPPDATEPAWHRLDIAEALEHFNSAAVGLSHSSAAQRLARDGPNRLPDVARRSAISMLIEQFNSLPVWLLGASAVVSAMTGGFVDAAAIIAVVLINAGIGFVTERQAERTIGALSQITAREARVLRDGTSHIIPASDVVTGDILELLPGHPVAADARLLRASRLSVDESSLTGESMPVDKATARLSGANVALADRSNMVYSGSVVTGGSGRALVIATGHRTEIGKIQALAGEATPPPTPMQQQLDRLGMQLGILSGLICLGVFGVGLLRGYGLLEMLKSSISLAVAAVPEGLPTIATTILAMGIREMRKHRVLIRHLGAVETLGSVQVLCLDKTGTLTINRMMVTDAQVGMRRIRIEQGRFIDDDGLDTTPRSEDEQQLLRILTLCNESEFEGAPGHYHFTGSPTENALLELALLGGLDVTGLRASHPCKRIKYRAEGRPYMSTEHDTPETGKLYAVKGHPLVLLERCQWVLVNGERQPLDDDLRATIVAENARMAGNALRVLGAAFSEKPVNSTTPLVWVGLVGMTDPIRPGMRELIASFHQAGIRTVMITGDQAGTATAIGQQLQLSRRGRSLEVLESSHLETLDQNLLAGLAQRVHIFARVSPAHKLQIVQALQKSGMVVAMTGDGINDGPALKAANIGVAMGTGGTEVARSVADIVLEDDNLHTKLVAIGQGRTIYNNIRKSLRFLLSTNLSEIEVMLAGVALGTTAPLNPMQLLWINLITDIFPGLALAMEEPEPDIMSQPPRAPDEPILRNEDLGGMALQSAFITAGALGSYGYSLARYGGGVRASTQAFMTLTLGQLLHALSCRSDRYTIFDRGQRPGNPYLQVALLTSLAAQVAAPFIPGLRGLLGLGPIGALDAAVIAGGAIAPLLINEGIKKGRQMRQTVTPPPALTAPAPKEGLPGEKQQEECH